MTLPWCINTGKSLIPLTLLFLHQKRNLLIPLELSRVMHQGNGSPTVDGGSTVVKPSSWIRKTAFAVRTIAWQIRKPSPNECYIINSIST